MPRISEPISIEEHSGDRYPDLETVQKLALPSLAGSLADMLHKLLVSGDLTREDGRIIVTPSQKGDTEHV